MCEAIRAVKAKVGIEVMCFFRASDRRAVLQSPGKQGVPVHNNLETSKRNFPNVCTTHTFEDKIQAIQAARAAGLEVCSGGIMGLGETIERPIDMALVLRELGVKSIR